MKLLTPEATLREWASEYQSACHCPGEPGYCHPARAHWTVQTLEAFLFADIFADKEAAAAWLAQEIQIDIDDELHRDWAQLLLEPIQDEAICIVRNNRAYIWDGYHRVAALIATGRPIVAIVGYPSDAIRFNCLLPPGS